MSFLLRKAPTTAPLRVLHVAPRIAHAPLRPLRNQSRNFWSSTTSPKPNYKPVFSTIGQAFDDAREHCCSRVDAAYDAAIEKAAREHVRLLLMELLEKLESEIQMVYKAGDNLLKYPAWALHKDKTLAVFSSTELPAVLDCYEDTMVKVARDYFTACGFRRFEVSFTKTTRRLYVAVYFDDTLPKLPHEVRKWMIAAKNIDVGAAFEAAKEVEIVNANTRT